jgi:hypothetical protein
MGRHRDEDDGRDQAGRKDPQESGTVRVSGLDASDVLSTPPGSIGAYPPAMTCVTIWVAA